MRIALITDGIWPYVLGGMQKHSYYLCKYFAQNGVDVHLFHFNQSEYAIEKLEFFSEEERKHIRATVIPFPDSAKGFGHYLVNSYRYSMEVYERLKDSLGDYDFIYTKGFTGWHLVREKRRSSLKFPPIGVKFHGYEMFQRPPDLRSLIAQKLLLQKPVREVSQQADIVFSYGGKITEIIKRIGVKPDHIVELPSGVEASTLAGHIKPTGSTRKFVYLGRYERRKGIEELTKALKQMGEPSFEFHFIGPIPEEKKLRRDNIIYHGEIRDRSKLTALLRECDVLVCPSWSEGMPNVILEAMANGLSVIATDVGATQLLVNGETGLLLEKCSVSLIRSAIQQTAALPPEALDRKKQAALRLITEKFTWEKLIPVLIGEIGEISSRG